MLYQRLKQSLLLLACVSGFMYSQTSLANQPSTAIVQSLTAGDRACYVELIDDESNASTQYADFEICEQNLVGERVQLTYEAGNIQAESCQGNPECVDTEEVMLIIDAEPIN